MTFISSYVQFHTFWNVKLTGQDCSLCLYSTEFGAACCCSGVTLHQAPFFIYQLFCLLYLCVEQLSLHLLQLKLSSFRCQFQSCNQSKLIWMNEWMSFLKCFIALVIQYLHILPNYSYKKSLPDYLQQKKKQELSKGNFEGYSVQCNQQHLKKITSLANTTDNYNRK